jgi:hypothetical protein
LIFCKKDVEEKENFKYLFLLFRFEVKMG